MGSRDLAERWGEGKRGVKGERDRERELILSRDITYTTYVYLGTGALAQSVKSPS